MYKTLDNARINVGELGVRFLVEAADTNGSASVLECDVPARSRMPVPHSHDGFEETIYGVEGITTWTIDGETIEVGPGEAVCVRRGQIHGFENHGDVDATFLAIATPGLFGPAYFREIAEVLAASAGGPPDLGAIGEVMRRHGLTPAGLGHRPSHLTNPSRCSSVCVSVPGCGLPWVVTRGCSLMVFSR